VSIGVTSLRAGDVDGSLTVDAADEALYAAKAAGRNQAQVAHGVPAARLAITEQR
jgi:GGDEF domain-containing protein